MDIYTKLARETLEKYLEKYELPEVKNLPVELQKSAACFVSLHNKNDNAGGKSLAGRHVLRGCIGTMIPVYKNLGGEIIANSISAAENDPRFDPIKFKDLNDLEISVDVLEKPEPIKSKKELDPKKYGVIVKSADGHSGLLLPNLDGVNTVQEQIDIACQKAGIDPQMEIFLYRFKSTRYAE